MPHFKKISYKQKAFLAGTMLVLFLCILFINNMVEKSQDKELKRNFITQSSLIVNEIEHTIDVNLTILQTLKSFFDSAHDITYDEFKRFSFRLLKDNPSIQALEWVPKISYENLLDFEQDARDKGFKSFFVYEKSKGKSVKVKKRDFYYPVYYIKPLKGNRKALGFDLGSSEKRLKAIKQASQSKNITITKAIELVQETKSQKAVLAFLPIYSPYTDQVQGFVLMVLRVSDLLKNSILGINTEKDLSIIVKENDEVLSAYYSRNVVINKEVLGKDILTSSRVIKVGNRQWTVFIERVKLFNNNSQLIIKNLILLLAVSISMLIMYCIYLLQLRENEYVLEISAHKKATRLSNERYKNLIEHSTDWFWEVNSSGVYTYSSANVEDLLGYKESDIVGKTPFDFMPENEAVRVLAVFSAYLDKQISFTNLENTNIHRNGQEVILSTSATPIFDDSGNLTGYRGTDRDITSQKNSQRLKQEKEQAEFANKSKSEFLANMSHELRTPLHGILSYAEMGSSRSEKATREKIKRYFDNIATSGSRLLVLINNLLDVSKLESGKMELKLAWYDLQKLIAECQNELAAKMQELKINFVVLNEEVILVNCDHLRIQQVIINLLSNAIKFSPAGATITVDYRKNDSNRVLITVTDQGDGLKTDQLESVFNKFTQAAITETGLGMGSTGLGLSISKGIITAHHGEIWAENSENSKVGGTFCFTLPIDSCEKSES